MCQFNDRASTVLGGDSGVRGPTLDVELEPAHPFPRRLETAVRERRLEYEDIRALPRDFFNQRARRRAADLLVRREQYPDRVREFHTGNDLLEDLRDDRQAGFHIVDARTKRPVAFNTKRQPFEGPSRPDCVIMAQEQHRLPIGRARESSK